MEKAKYMCNLTAIMSQIMTKHSISWDLCKLNEKQSKKCLWLLLISALRVESQQIELNLKN